MTSGGELVEPQVLLIHFLSRLTGDGVSSAGGTSNTGAFFGGRAGRLIIGTGVFPPFLSAPALQYCRER